MFQGMSNEDIEDLAELQIKLIAGLIATGDSMATNKLSKQLAVWLFLEMDHLPA